MPLNCSEGLNNSSIYAYQSVAELTLDTSLKADNNASRFLLRSILDIFPVTDCEKRHSLSCMRDHFGSFLTR